MTRRYAIAAALLACAIPGAADSLYQAGSYLPLTADLRARHVGDLVTVMVYESASASSLANTSVGRASSVGVDLQAVGKVRAAGLSANNQLDGRGLTQREGRVLAQITVAVSQVADNGDLRIRGEQVLDINNERQQISLEGTIRSRDISDTNVVQSTRIANAKISYVGQGDLADRQRPSWWQHLLSLFGI